MTSMIQLTMGLLALTLITGVNGMNIIHRLKALKNKESRPKTGSGAGADDYKVIPVEDCREAYRVMKAQNDDMKTRLKAVNDLNAELLLQKKETMRLVSKLDNQNKEIDNQNKEIRGTTVWKGIEVQRLSADLAKGETKYKELQEKYISVVAEQKDLNARFKEKEVENNQLHSQVGEHEQNELKLKAERKALSKEVRRLRKVQAGLISKIKDDAKTISEKANSVYAYLEHELNKRQDLAYLEEFPRIMQECIAKLLDPSSHINKDWFGCKSEMVISVSKAEQIVKNALDDTSKNAASAIDNIASFRKDLSKYICQAFVESFQVPCEEPQIAGIPAPCVSALDCTLARAINHYDESPPTVHDRGKQRNAGPFNLKGSQNVELGCL